jgi:hypothetical protein
MHHIFIFTTPIAEDQMHVKIMERHINTLKQQEVERKKILAQRQQEELDKCTFVPKTKECPAYVKRIARSLSIVKKSKIVDDDLGNLNGNNK